MANVITNEGRNFAEYKITNSTSYSISKVAVGTGTKVPSTNDTSLQNEKYRGDESGSNINIEKTSNTGEFKATIEVTGGTEVESGEEVSEFGLFTDESDPTLFYHETSTPTTVQSGETVIFEIRIRSLDLDTESNQVITDVGEDFIAERLVGEAGAYLDRIAVGESTKEVTSGDTAMFSEVYRNDKTGSNVILDETRGVTGEIDARISISAGPDSDDEISNPPQDISEFGLITSDNRLVLHETRETITLETGDDQTFKIPFSIKQ